MSVSLRDVCLLSLQRGPVRTHPRLPLASRSYLPVPPGSHPRLHLSSLSKMNPIAKHDTGQPLGSQGVALGEGDLGGEKKDGKVDNLAYKIAVPLSSPIRLKHRL